MSWGGYQSSPRTWGGTSRPSENDFPQLDDYPQGSGVTRLPEHNTEVTPYVVDSNGDAPYTTLHCAMEAALRDAKGSNRTPTILLRAGGTYELTSIFKTRRPVNIVGTSFNGNPAPRVVGCTQSGGNTTWNGVEFRGSKSHYIVNSGKSCGDDGTAITDTFEKCEFSHNFKVTVINDHALFNNCVFNYELLTRDAVMEVAEGQGFMTFLKSRFYICRTGSGCATSFLHVKADTCVNKTVLLHNKFKVESSGKDIFIFHRIEGSQPVHHHSGYFEVLQAQGKFLVFGSPYKVYNTELNVKSSWFIGSENCNQAAVTGNLWTKKDSSKPHIYHANLIHTMQAANYDTKCNGRYTVTKQKCSVDGSYTSAVTYRGGGNCCSDSDSDSDDEDCPCPSADSDSALHYKQWTHNHIITNNRVAFVYNDLTSCEKTHFHTHSNFVFSPLGVTVPHFTFNQKDLSNTNVYNPANPTDPQGSSKDAVYVEFKFYQNTHNNHDPASPHILRTTVYNFSFGWAAPVVTAEFEEVRASSSLVLGFSPAETTSPLGFLQPIDEGIIPIPLPPQS